MHRRYIPSLRTLAFVGLLAGATLLAGCGKSSSKESGAPALIELQSDWYAQGEHGGYYQAVAKGFYKEAGINVEIRQGGPGNYPAQLVATGQVAFAMGTSDGIVLAVKEGLPLVIVCAYMQHDPQALLLHEENPINSFKELDGKTIMAVVGVPWLGYLQKKFGITLNVIPLNFGLAQFMADKNFIQQCFVSNEPFFVRQAGGKPKALLIADSGYDPYRVIFTSQKFAREHPEAVRAFVAASIKGYQDYLHGDPSPGNQLITARNPNMTGDLVNYSRQSVIERKLVEGFADKPERIGLITKKRMREQVETLVQLQMLKTSVPLESFVNFDFMPAEYRELVNQ